MINIEILEVKQLSDNEKRTTSGGFLGIIAAIGGVIATVTGYVKGIDSLHEVGKKIGKEITEAALK